MIELPKDVEGREIPLDTDVLYDDNGQAYEVKTYCYAVHEDMPDSKWVALLFSKKSVELKIIRTTALYLTTPDSWEKLEEDLDRCIEESDLCSYYSKNLDCNNCTISGNESRGCTSVALEDIKKRIRKLRGEDE
jgi:hypothetical protein